MTLRDLNLLFENTIAPKILLTNKPLSYILVILFDAIGFSNYQFLRVAGEKEDIIPYFFVGPDTSMAQVLQQLAVSTQTAMFFNEQNMFTMMSKNYLMPTSDERPTNITFSSDNGPITNIVSKQNDVYNSGKITYVSRYIQKSYGSIQQSSYDLKDKTWIYKPVLLWEVAAPENMRPTNQETSNASAYSLSAIPLNTDLTTDLPTIVDGDITNNILDFGEGIDWLSRYSGYFYANGEVIKYDAVEHIVSGQPAPVWITNNKEYSDYFAKLTFNGKIYPTGRVRIYSEPYFNEDGTYKNGVVAKHGRGQFGTPVVYHNAGLASEWTDPANLYGCQMDSSVLFNNAIKSGIVGKAGIETKQSKNTTVNGIIKNFLSSQNIPEAITNTLKKTVNGSVQSSALIMNGPSFDTTLKPTDYVSYVAKDFASPTFKQRNKFAHFGTRVRIIGSVGNTTDTTQTGIGSQPFYNIQAQDITKTLTTPEGLTYDVKITTKESVVGGSSGGLAVLLNTSNNNGYYFEIAALTDNNVSNYSGNVPINNMFFYKIARDSAATSDAYKAVPLILWSGLAPILVDDGKFTGQSRMMGEQNPTVYDLAVEYRDNSVGSRTFYLYVNNKIVAVVDDTTPLPHTGDTNAALFVRGSSRLMFENFYALALNQSYSLDSSAKIDAPIADGVFGTTDLGVTDSFRKYTVSGLISSTYLSGIGSGQSPDYNIYYDEFGTIMREAAYMNIRYDKAYPALLAKMSPTFNNLKGYTVSGYVGNPYGAEFLIFNNTDSILTLDENSGNYLRIQGVTFTQQSQNELTVDDYFAKVSDFSSYKFDPISTNQNKQFYTDIKASRMTYGKKEFVLDAPFIQTQDAANSMMDWVIKKVMHPRKSVGLEIFAMPILQLGDIVTLDYVLNGVDELSSSRFIVYNIQYSKQQDGPRMTVYLSEVSNG